MENNQNLMALVGNMALAHEMIMNDDFQLKSINETTNLSIHKKVHDIMHKAFWDVLEEEVNSNPPQYKNAFNLLMEMKEMIMEILPKGDGLLMKKQIEEVLDGELIKQQIEHEAFDILSCAGYILDILSKMCAPVRDQAIFKLKSETGLIPLLRGTFEVINLMKMDLVNYEINALKPILMQEAVKYEGDKFEEYLQENTEGLHLTKEWLSSALDVICTLRGTSENKISSGVVITNAYLSLLSTKVKLYPETLLMDEVRLQQVAYQFENLIHTVSILTYCLHFLPPHLNTDESFISHLKRTILILIQSSEWNEEQIENIYLQVFAETEKECKKRELEMKPSTQWEILNNQMKDLLSEENHLKSLITSRVRDYVLISMTSSKNLDVPTFTVLSPIKNELRDATVKFIRVVLHNKKVHNERYNVIVNELISAKEKESQIENQESQENIPKESQDS